MIDTEKTCKTCKHFEKHYAWVDGHFYSVCCGHCNVRKRTKKILKESICDKWEKEVDKIKIRKKNIKEELLCMAMRVNDIALFLEIEKDIID